ncbi:MAG: hypothetical protein ACOCVN_00915 [bacterium]
MRTNIKKYSILCIILVCLSFSFGFLHNARSNFTNHISVLKTNQQSGIYDLPFSYFLKNGTCMYSMSDLYYFIHDRPVDIISIHKLVDPFSTDLDRINLIPLFNKASSRWEGVLMLSAGIDGKMNYEYTLKDTIFIDEYKSLDLFYNSVNDLSLDEDFNPFDLLWGKKDLLISYNDCRESFKKSGSFGGVKDLDSLIVKLDARLRAKKPIMLNRIYTVELPSNSIAWENDTLVGELKNGYIVSFQFYDNLEIESFKRAGERRLVCKMAEFDGERKKVKFIMCMNPDYTDL